MRLVLDLRFVPDAERFEADRIVRLSDLAAMIRRPPELARLLWGTRWDTISVVEDTLPKSGVQAGALGLASLSRARRYELHVDGVTRAIGRLPFFLRAVRRFVVAMPAEAWRVARLWRRTEHFAGAELELPRRPDRIGRVAYLRAEPIMAWMGAFVGGAATHTTGVINGLRANGLDVHVYARRQPDGTEGVPFTPVPLHRVFHIVHWLTITSYGLDLADLVARDSADFVYQRYAQGSFAGLEAARRLGVPLVLEFNGSEIWTDKHWGAGELQHVELLSALERRNLESASLVVVVSDVLKEQLAEHGIPAEKVLVNPNGVDVDRLAPLREGTAAQWRERCGLPEAPTVGFIGTFGLWHGVLLLPDMIERVAAAKPDVRWVLIGDGRHYDQVKREISERGLADRAEMPGLVPHERAVELLAACDVCVSPHVPNPDGSRFFGSPTKLFEYMGLAKPIVASDLEQIGEVLDHERTALLCPPGDAEAAAAGVVRLLDDKKLSARLGAAALEEARVNYGWDRHVERILKVLAER